VVLRRAIVAFSGKIRAVCVGTPAATRYIGRQMNRP
jgi:hypothetical protein